MAFTTPHSAASDAAPLTIDPALLLREPSSLPKLTFNPDDYADYVADLELTPEQQRELLEAMWALIVAFVDVGFGIHPIQHALAKAHPEFDCVELPDLNPDAVADVAAGEAS